jgi:hypothetical protein
MKTRAVVVPILVLLLSSAGVARQIAPPAPPEYFTALASNISEIGGTGIGPLDIEILGWTSDADNERVMAGYGKRGQEGVIEVLEKVEPLARIKQPGRLAFDLHYARQTVNPDGTRRIILLTYRYIGFSEAVARTRTLDYPFLIIDMKIDATGRGEGQLFIAAKVIRTGNLLVIENLATTAVNLKEIKPRKE